MADLLAFGGLVKETWPFVVLIGVVYTAAAVQKHEG